MDAVRGHIESAAEDGAQLILLPNYTGYSLFGLFAPELAGTRDLDLLKIAGALHFESVPRLMRERAQFVYDLYQHVFQSLAEHTNTWLVPGSTPEWSEPAWYNTVCLFGPDGQIIARQRQAHRSAMERAAEMGVGTELAVYETDAARVGLVIGEDIRYPEVSRILALKGATLLVHPAAFAPIGDEQFLIDLWREVQSNQVFGTQATLLAEHLGGRSAIYAPVEMTPDHRGILAQARTGSEPETVYADLDFAALQKVVDEYPIFEMFNYGLYEGLGRQVNK